MHINYLKAADELKAAMSDIKQLMESASRKSFEDKIAYRYLEGIVEKMDVAIDRIEHYSRPAKEGTLREMDNEKFELLDKNGKHVRSFSCGSPIECFIEYDDEAEWHSGRVEHTTRDGYSGYYFYGADKPFLYTGMRARIRV